MVKRYMAADYADLVALFHSHNIPAPDMETLPTIGYIWPGVAAGFLYMTDSSIAIIDNFITGKQAERVAKDKALDEIVLALLAAAKASGSQIVKCDTNIHAIKQRATKHGFDCIGSYQSFVRRV